MGGEERERETQKVTEEVKCAAFLDKDNRPRSIIGSQAWRNTTRAHCSTWAYVFYSGIRSILTVVHLAALQAGPEQQMHGLWKPPSAVGKRQVGYRRPTISETYTSLHCIAAMEPLSVLNARESIGASSQDVASYVSPNG